MKFLFLPLLLWVSLSSYGQVLHQSPASGYTRLGAYSIQQTDVFSFSANQASLAQVKHAQAGVYAERKFMLAALANYRGAFALPTSSGNFGLQAIYYGSPAYNESKLGLAYARSLGTKLDIGAQFNYNNIRIAGYGAATAISFEAGTILHLGEQLHAGIHVNNPVGGKFGKEQQEKLPAIYTMGLGYEASEKFFTSIEISKEEDQPVNVYAGMQYKFVPQLFARAGIATAASTLWLGVGVLWKSFRLDATATYHSQLGITPGVLLLFDFKKDAE